MPEGEGISANGQPDEVAVYRGLAAGWYRDRANAQMARYWDGSVLSEERRPIKDEDDELAPYRGLGAGWYRDPANAQMARYWDGESLGDELRPLAARQPEPVVEEPPPPAPQSPPSSPAGWYRDPISEDLIRYWDGTQWTEHTAPKPD